MRQLAQGYEAYALQRQYAKDTQSSAHFADKALMAATGKPTDPETLTGEAAQNGEGVALVFARERLMKALADDYIGKEPAKAAQAVLSYDCWADLQRSGRDSAQLQVCQQEYFENYAALTEALTMHAKAALEEQARIDAAALAAKEAAKAAQEDQAPAASPQQNYEPVPIESSSTIIYFPFDSDRPGEVASALLDELIRYILGAKDVQVLIHGHADRAGSDAYNLALSERRAAYVRGRLVESGVSEKHIQHYGFGESDPKVPTADGVREPYNRRVEIFIE